MTTLSFLLISIGHVSGDFLSYTNYMETKLNLIKEKREVEDKIQLGEQMIYSLKMIDMNRKFVL